VERDGPFGAVRSCPLQQRSHPSNLREDKAQGRTCPRRKRRTPTRADRRREHGQEETQKPNRSILDRPTHRAPDSWFPSPFSRRAYAAIRWRETRRSNASTGPADRAAKTPRPIVRPTARGSGHAETRTPTRQRDQTCEGTIWKTPRAPSGKRRRKRYRHTRDDRPASLPAKFTGRKPKQASRRRKGARPGHVTPTAGSGTPADQDSAGA
jgi:hypothetical protein